MIRLPQGKLRAARTDAQSFRIRGDVVAFVHSRGGTPRTILLSTGFAFYICNIFK
jgi:hypothetical protein